mgnify:CR=1 FL=1
MTGMLNTAVGLAVIYAAMFFWKVHPLAANAMGYGAGLLLGYTINRSWTFKNTGKHRSTLPLYLLVMALGYLLNVAALFVLTRHFSLNPYVAQLAGIGLYTAFTYTGCKQWVFHHPPVNSSNPTPSGCEL